MSSSSPRPSRARRLRRRTALDRMPPALLFAGALATSITALGGLAVLSVL
ncbi:MAG: hypothetical protein RIB45_15130 [Marivibrio sp.]